MEKTYHFECQKILVVLMCRAENDDEQFYSIALLVAAGEAPFPNEDCLRARHADRPEEDRTVPVCAMSGNFATRPSALARRALSFSSAPSHVLRRSRPEFQLSGIAIPDERKS